MYAVVCLCAVLSGRLGVRDYISGRWARSVCVCVCVRLAFALFLEITLFVVLLSLYIFTGGRFTFSLRRRPHACLRISSLAYVVCLCARVLSISLFLSFSLSPTLHHRDFVIPRFLRQCIRRRKRSCAEVSVALEESDVSLARLLQVISRLADSQ